MTVCLNYGMVKLVLLITFALSVTVEASGLRNIFSLCSAGYFSGASSVIYENTSIIDASPGYSIIARSRLDNRNDGANTIVYLGAVRKLDGRNYIETLYGYGTGFDMRHADYFSASINRETAKYYSAIEYRLSFYPGYSVHLISPALRYYISGPVSLWGKSFISVDSNSSANYAFWGETEYEIMNDIIVNGGFTFGDRLYSLEYEDNADMRFSSLIAGIAYRLNGYVNLKMIHETLTYSSNAQNFKYTFLVDSKF